MSSVPTCHHAVSEQMPLNLQVSWCDRLLSAILLLLLSPLLLGIAIVTLVLSGKSPLIAHRRVGQYGSDPRRSLSHRLLKRTMDILHA